MLVCGFAGSFFVSCIDDKGNYDYDSKESILNVSIRSFRDTPTITGSISKMVNETLTVSPEVTGDEGGGFYYKWFTIPGLNFQAGLRTRDTVTLMAGPDAKNLQYVLKTKAEGGKIDPGDYQLFFQVWKDDMVVQTDPLTLQILRSDAKLSLQWFILKESGDGNTEVDFYNPEEPDETKRLITNVLGNSSRLTYPGTAESPLKGYESLPQGNPVSIGYVPVFAMDYPVLGSEAESRVWYWAKTSIAPSGTWTNMGGGGNQGVLYVVSEGDMRVYDIVTQTEIANPERLFDPYSGVLDQLGSTMKFQNFTTSQWWYDYNPFSYTAGYHSVWAILNNTTDNTNLNIWPASTAKLTTSTLMKFWGSNIYSKVIKNLNGTETSEITPYNMHPDFVRTFQGRTIIFDLNSHSFLRAQEPFPQAQYENFPMNWDESSNWYLGFAVPAGMPELRNMEYDLVAFANDQWSIRQGPGNHIAALMKGYDGSPKEDKFMLLLPDDGSVMDDVQLGPGTLGSAYNTFPFKSKHEIPDGDWYITKPGAKIHLHGAININLWTAYGNSFYRYMPYDGLSDAEREFPVLQLPADEEIVYFYQYDEYNGHGNLIRMVVLSNSTSGQWHVRVFDVGQTDNLSTMLVENDLLKANTGSTAKPADDESGFLMEHFWGEGKAKRTIYTNTEPLWGSYFN